MFKTKWQKKYEKVMDRIKTEIELQEDMLETNSNCPLDVQIDSHVLITLLDLYDYMNDIKNGIKEES